MAHLAHFREAHPLAFVVTHWINLISFIMLILSGFYIHYPAFGGFMGVARGAHFFFMFLLLANMIVRIILAFVLDSSPTEGTHKVHRDYKNWLPQKLNRHQLGAWIKYYLFLKKDHPLAAKYGVPQKLSYVAIPFLIIIMAITGFCLYGPTMNMAFFSLLNDAVGGPMNMRIIHYFMMFVFIIFIIIHVYMANIEGFAPTKAMFLRKEHEGLTIDPETSVITGYEYIDENNKESKAIKID